MGVLYDPEAPGNRSAAWELSNLASTLGLPKPPDLKLPQLPALVGACDFTALAASIGQTAADALKARLLDPAVQGVMLGDLNAKKTQLLSYLAGLETQKTALLGQISGGGAIQSGLGEAQELLGGVRTALGGVVDSPLGAAVLADLEQACPVAAGLVSYAESAVDTVSADLGGLGSYLGDLMGRLDALTSFQAVGAAALAEIDAHLNILPTLLGSLENT